MILAGFLYHFTFYNVITCIMYVISVDNAKNTNSFVQEDKSCTINNFSLLG